MNDEELDALVATAGSPSPGKVESLLVGGPAIELRELIMTTTDKTLTDIQAAEDTLKRDRSHRRTAGRRRGPAMVAVAVAAAAAAAIVISAGTSSTRGEIGGGTSASPAFTGSSAQPDNTVSFAAEFVAVAEVAPRLLVTADGWSVVRADQFGAEYGELEFSNGEQTLGLFWRPMDLHQTYVDDRAESAGPPSDITVAGYAVTRFYTPYGETSYALWIEGDHSVELRADEMSKADFLALVATLEAVDVETWLGAMPESVVTPVERDRVIEEMLTGIPVPPAFDESVLAADGVSDRYQLGAQVSGTIACAWFEIWIAADASGGSAGKRQAADAMATSRTWPILLEMQADGDYPDVLWEYADDLANDGFSAKSGRDTIRTGEYKGGLGC